MNSNGIIKNKSKINYLLLVLALISVFAYFNFGRLHGTGRHTHHWEMYHYYINAKYFHELGYFDLYNATIVADSEDDNYLKNVNQYRNLRDYQFIIRDAALKDSARIKSLFSDSRWRQFKHDINYIKNIDKRLQLFINDHGFNATPIWTITGYLIANSIPVEWLELISWFDVILFVIMLISVFVSFGLEAGMVTSIFFFINFYTNFRFIGGSMMRYDWLASLLIGISLLNRKKFFISGIFFSYSTLVRLFPLLFVFFLGTKMIIETIKKRKLQTDYLKFFGGFALTALFLSASTFILGSPEKVFASYSEKIKLHEKVLLTNNIGFKMILLSDSTNYSKKAFGEKYANINPEKDIFENWANIKIELFNKMKPFYFILLIIFAGILIFITRNKNDVEAAGWGAVLLFFSLGLTNYYYAFLVIFFLSLFHGKINLNHTISMILLLLISITAFMIFLYDDFDLRMFLLMSHFILLSFLYIIGKEFYDNLRTFPEKKSRIK
jgi:hypothetical protein